MTNPTNPFNWQMPTASDLVTDLPADFETFGQAVATSMADLLGGTTGQVLSKASNTNMDFTWVTTDDANAIQNSIVDAKGDIVAASANDTPARLAVGNNGETLVADSSTSTGLRYTGNYAAGKNGILNSNFDIWQRGTTATSTTDGYQADRWYNYKTGINVTVSQQATTLQNLPNCARFQRVSGQTGTSSVALAQMFENAQSVTYANQTITVSFWARKGADYSAASSLLSWRLITGTGATTANVFTQGYTSQATTGTGSVTLTTSWQRFSVNVTIPSTTTQMSFYFITNFVGTAGTNDYFEVTGVQLETGSVATAFQTATGTIQGELAACQRYYYRNTPGTAYGWHSFGNGETTTTLIAPFQPPVSMRVTPTAVEYSNLQINEPGSGAITITAVSVSGSYGGPNITALTVSAASGLVANKMYRIINNNNAAGYLAVSAEL
jgi:hypothetical protein